MARPPRPSASVPDKGEPGLSSLTAVLTDVHGAVRSSKIMLVSTTLRKLAGYGTEAEELTEGIFTLWADIIWSVS